MIDVNQVAQAFPELLNIRTLGAGAGGQKFVFRASQNSEEVVLKLLRVPAATPQGDAAAQRVEREILASTTLQSAYVPKVYSCGERVVDSILRTYIIEAFIDGKTLREQMRATPVWDRPSVCVLVRALLEACLDFENAKLVHRDIKPENLITDIHGRTWVIDFGLVKFHELVSLTRDSATFGVGTYGYAAPEQQSNNKDDTDVRADLFSVGVVAHELLTGGNPFIAGKRDFLAVMKHVREQDLPEVPFANDAEHSLSEFVRLLVGRFPSRRPQTAQEALDYFKPVYIAVTGRSW